MSDELLQQYWDELVQCRAKLKTITEERDQFQTGMGNEMRAGKEYMSECRKLRDDVTNLIKERDKWKRRFEELPKPANVIATELQRVILERDALKEALEKYAIHRGGCEWLVSVARPCTCGLHSILPPRSTIAQSEQDAEDYCLAVEANRQDAVKHEVVARQEVLGMPQGPCQCHKCVAARAQKAP